ncbi:GntR family transcriptional regulator [Streptomyces sp. NPDC001914]|uniref:GntR family transcriptional regulator n=1 Tax=Streptomyces sp. NPDC001914 TaxID=3364623 RepID=UPI0036B0D8F3
MTKRVGYADIAAHYRQKIDDGDLQPSERMPTMEAVRDHFEVSMATVNRAYKLLKAEGYTTSRPGSSTVVAVRPRIVATGAARLERLQRTGKHYAPDETSTDHVSMLRSCGDPDIAEQLGVDLHDEIVIRRRVFRREGRPTVVALSCIHPRALGSMPELMTQGQLKPFWQTTYTQRTGREVKRSPERRGARLASADELKSLEVNVPATAAVPVLVLHTTFHDEEGPLEVWEDVYAPGLWQVAND